jgi:hypothetical protein
MSTGHTTTGCHPQLNKRSDQIRLHAPTTRYLCPFRPKHSRLNAAHRQGPSISFAITDVRYRPLLFWNVVKSVLCTCSYLPIRTKREEIPQDISITIASSDRNAQASASFVASRQPVVGRSDERNSTPPPTLPTHTKSRRCRNSFERFQVGGRDSQHRGDESRHSESNEQIGKQETRVRPSARRSYSVGRSGRHTNQHVVFRTSSHQIDRTARKRLERRAVSFLSSPFLSSASQLLLLIHIVHSLLFSYLRLFSHVAT